MSAFGIGAVVLSFAAGLACCVAAMVSVGRRRGGRIAWRGVVIGHKPYATFLALLAIGLILNGVADLLAESDRRHPAYLIAVAALLCVAAGAVVAKVAVLAARRSST